MRLQALALLLVLAACGDDVAHLSLPHVVDHGGPVLTELNLVTITYPDDHLAELGARFDEAVPGSAWLRAVGAEYGVRGGRHLAAYTMPDPAPALVTYDEAAKLGPSLAAAGLVPGPTVDGVPVLYVEYFPPTTTIANDDGTSPMCVGALAYHDWSGGAPVAVIPTCYLDSAVARTMFTSHEIIEAATDPFGTGYYVDPPDPDDPYHYAGAEVADLCNRAIAPPEGGFAFEGSWSNAEADAWTVHPCQPVAPGDVFTTVVPDPATVVVAQRGAQVSWDLTGFASGPTDAWTLEARHGYAGDSGAANDEFADSVSFSPAAIADGGHATATATVPADATPGTIVAANVWSRTTWALIAVRVQ